jgi:hypothetical protein
MFFIDLGTYGLSQLNRFLDGPINSAEVLFNTVVNSFCYKQYPVILIFENNGALEAFQSFDDEIHTQGILARFNRLNRAMLHVFPHFIDSDAKGWSEVLESVFSCTSRTLYWPDLDLDLDPDPNTNFDPDERDRVLRSYYVGGRNGREFFKFPRS